MPQVELPIEKWAGKVYKVTLGGGGRKQVTVGGENTLPFLHFEGTVPYPPAVAIEVQDKFPADWSEVLHKDWGEMLKNPVSWAQKAAEEGADLIYLKLISAHPEEDNTGAEHAKRVVEAVLSAVELPLLVVGPEVAEKDNEVLVAASEVARGQRIALGNCVDKNYRTIAASCLADGHVAIAKSPVDVNLAKQLNILLCDMGLSPDAILMDPSTGALGYGLEYTYSVMERLRLAALSGDKMTAQPIICTVGEDSWKQKEAKVGEGVPSSWGKLERRAILWEEVTALSLIHAGANIVVLRHPASLVRIKEVIQKLCKRNNVSI